MEERKHVKITLQNWVKVNFTDDDGIVVRVVVWGEPIDNPSRFVVTSQVTAITDETLGESQLVETQNSLCRVIGKGSETVLPLTCADLLAKGHSPDGLVVRLAVKAHAKRNHVKNNDLRASDDTSAREEPTVIDCTINQWCLVEIYDKKLEGQIVWGIVDIDYKRRFERGDYVCTSLITAMDFSVVHTMNSTYKLQGNGHKFVLHSGALPYLRSGYSPNEIISLHPHLKHPTSPEQNNIFLSDEETGKQSN